MQDQPIHSFAQKLWPHILELRKRLMYCLLAFFVVFIGCYFYAQEIYAFLVHPLAEAMFQQNGQVGKMIYTGLAEAFVTYVKLSLWTAFFLCFPLFLVQIWLFIAPGLYENERKAILPYLFVTPVLFFLGSAFVYYIIFPYAWSFFLSFELPIADVNQGMPILLEARVSQYLSIAMTLIFAFGLSFELPVILVLLMRMGVLQVETLIRGRRYAIVLVFIVAAILTPPDIMSQIALAIPLMILYEISIFIGKMQKKQHMVQ